MATAGDNFYLFVNSSWLNDPKNKIPEEYSRWGSFMQLRDDVTNKLTALVKELSNKNENELNEDEKKIVAVWNASMNRFRDWEDGKENYFPLKNEINKIAKLFENEDENQFIINIAEYIGHSNEYSLNSFIEFRTTVDYLEADSI